jgi:hypothetical protein
LLLSVILNILDNGWFFRELWFTMTFLSNFAVSPMAENWSRSEKVDEIGLSSVTEFDSPPSPPESRISFLRLVFLAFRGQTHSSGNGLMHLFDFCLDYYRK